MLTALRHPGCACQQRRLPGAGSPSLPPVAQVFNLCVFQVRYGTLVRLRKGEQPDRRHAQKPVRLVPRWGAPKRSRRELTSPAGVEHASGRLRCRDGTTESSVNLPQPAMARRALPACLEPGWRAARCGEPWLRPAGPQPAMARRALPACLLKHHAHRLVAVDPLDRLAEEAGDGEHGDVGEHLAGCERD